MTFNTEKWETDKTEYIAIWTELIKELIPTIDDDYRSQYDDSTPSMDLTVATDGNSWAYQTGDNSFSGACYGYANWAVTVLYRDTNAKEMAEELADQIDDLIHW